jgi:hypothetical protein
MSTKGTTNSITVPADTVAESQVRNDTPEPGERQAAEVAGTGRAERGKVIETARRLDPDTFDIDTRLATHPGKYEGASDLQLAVALDIINGHGFADESTGDTAINGYAWRVSYFVGIEDSQGFVSAEEHSTIRHAVDRLRTFDVSAENDES